MSKKFILMLHGKPNISATLVTKIPADTVPDPLEVKKYYGPDTHRSSYSATPVTRLVFLTQTGAYVVIPDTKQARDQWYKQA